MYRKVMMQIYLLEDVCKKLYVKVVFRNYNFVEKIVEKKSFQKGKLPCCPKSRATNPPNARALISWPRGDRGIQEYLNSRPQIRNFTNTKKNYKKGRNLED